MMGGCEGGLVDWWIGRGGLGGVGRQVESRLFRVGRGRVTDPPKYGNTVERSEDSSPTWELGTWDLT